MDAKAFLDQMLNSAKTLTEQGRGLAEDKLGVPEDGTERDAMLSGMGKGAMAAGALALLLGTSTGRRLTGSALKLGGLAAVGTIAYQAFQNWQSQQGAPAGDVGIPVDKLDTAAGNARSEILLEAMILAANADGHIDAAERTKIEQRADMLGLAGDNLAFIQSRLTQPGSLAELAARSDSAETAAEIYLVSRLLIDSNTPAEEAYRLRLIDALKLDPTLLGELEAQIGST